jgi:hypothetical protein
LLGASARHHQRALGIDVAVASKRLRKPRAVGQGHPCTVTYCPHSRSELGDQRGLTTKQVSAARDIDPDRIRQIDRDRGTEGKRDLRDAPEPLLELGARDSPHLEPSHQRPRLRQGLARPYPEPMGASIHCFEAAYGGNLVLGARLTEDDAERHPAEQSFGSRGKLHQLTPQLGQHHRHDAPPARFVGMR